MRNELELEAVRNNINAGGKYPADNADNAYILMKDLDLGTRDWASIGNSAHAFSGTFLGNGKTISGKLTTYGSNAGLFGFVSNAYFENLLLKIDLTAMVHGSQYIGALIGQSNASVIKNCHETGNISDPQNYQFGNWVDLGGLIGALIDSKLLNSSSHSNVTFFNISTSGGLVGSSVNSEIDQCFSECKIRSGHNNEYIDAIGGLVGNFGPGKINNSYAIGDINLSNHSYAYYQDYIPQQIGGLVGAAKGGNITNTHASVNITAPSINMVGGLVGGCNISLASEITITNSYATGDVSCREGCGGLVGSANHLSVSHSHATGKVSAVYTAAGGLLGSGYNSQFEGCYATGDTTAGGYTTYGHVGGLIGYLENSTAENVYATGNVTMTSPEAYSNGGAIGRAVACTLNNIYAKGNVNGGVNTGGLIGIINRSTIKNCAALNQKVISGWGGALFGAIYEDYRGEWYRGNTNITNCITTANSNNGTLGAYISIDHVTLKNIFTTGSVLGTGDQANAFIGLFDNANLLGIDDRNGGSLVIRNSYYWSKAGGKGVVGGNTPDEPSIYGMIYNQDKQAVLEDDPTMPLIDALGEDWTEVTCKLSSGPGTEKEEEYLLPVPKVFGKNICK